MVMAFVALFVLATLPATLAKINKGIDRINAGRVLKD